MSTAEMLAAGMKGKGFAVLHTYMDHLWWVYCQAFGEIRNKSHQNLCPRKLKSVCSTCWVIWVQFMTITNVSATWFWWPQFSYRSSCLSWRLSIVYQFLQPEYNYYGNEAGTSLLDILILENHLVLEKVNFESFLLKNGYLCQCHLNKWVALHLDSAVLLSFKLTFMCRT